MCFIIKVYHIHFIIQPSANTTRSVFLFPFEKRGGWDWSLERLGSLPKMWMLNTYNHCSLQYHQRGTTFILQCSRPNTASHTHKHEETLIEGINGNALSVLFNLHIEINILNCWVVTIFLCEIDIWRLRILLTSYCLCVRTSSFVYPSETRVHLKASLHSVEACESPWPMKRAILEYSLLMSFLL